MYADGDFLNDVQRLFEVHFSANRLCTNGQNDCDQNARCIEKGSNDYTCVCHAGFMDRSPDPSKTGEFLVPSESRLIFSFKNKISQL